MVFEDSGVVGNGTRLQPWADALRPLCDAAAHLQVQEGEMWGDLYTGATRTDELKATLLLNGALGRPVTVAVTLKDIEGSHTELHVRVEGDPDHVDVVKAAVTPVLRRQLWKYQPGG